MGFMGAMKGANNNWGLCTSSDFRGPCYLGPKNRINNSAQELMISGTGLAREYVFTGKDVKSCEVKASGGTWIWFHIEFLDGKHVEFFMPSVLDAKGNLSMNLLNFVAFMKL